MTKIYLLDPLTDVFQSFQNINQLYGFASRSTRNWNGKTLIIRKGDKARVVELKNEVPSEILSLALKLEHEIQ